MLQLYKVHPVNTMHHCSHYERILMYWKLSSSQKAYQTDVWNNRLSYKEALSKPGLHHWSFKRKEAMFWLSSSSVIRPTAFKYLDKTRFKMKKVDMAQMFPLVRKASFGAHAYKKGVAICEEMGGFLKKIWALQNFFEADILNNA